jgi:hypothetical protein
MKRYVFNPTKRLLTVYWTMVPENFRLFGELLIYVQEATKDDDPDTGGAALPRPLGSGGAAAVCSSLRVQKLSIQERCLEIKILIQMAI